MAAAIPGDPGLDGPSWAPTAAGAGAAAGGGNDAGATDFVTLGTASGSAAVAAVGVEGTDPRLASMRATTDPVRSVWPVGTGVRWSAAVGAADKALGVIVEAAGEALGGTADATIPGSVGT